ncbi:MAG: hypothetical protein IH886_14080 [Nitrospinae bacterium]|nr:hypothetical protein [Nitrospinota bacterium]
MSHGHTKISSKGICIYCGKAGVRLTDEHIVPMSIGGKHVIKEASCHNCAKVTSKFERDVMRGLWGDARTSYDAPSRRKKNRSTHITLNDPHHPSKKLRVPFSEYPSPMVFYQMDHAGILQGLPETVDLSANWKLITITDEEKLQIFVQKYPGKLTAQFKHVPGSFARLIAKIGYGQALCLLNPSDFRPICLPYILGEKKNVSFIVGSSSNNAEPNKEFGYILRTAGFGNIDQIMIVSEVRLIANNHTPIYHVVVGDVTGQENVEKVIKKLGVIDITLLPEKITPTEKALEKHEWMPQVWPLPFWQT